MESLNDNKTENQKSSGSKKINNAGDTKSAGRPKMKDNNDDNEFATNGLKASFSVESKVNDRDAKEAQASEIPTGGSVDKVESDVNAVASAFEQKFNARMEDLAGMVAKTGAQIQRLGEALCRIGDKVEHLPEGRFGAKKSKASDTSANIH